MEAIMDSEHHQAHHEHHEEHHEQEAHHRGGGRRWLTGFLLGGALGVAASLLIAPQSGRQTRELLRYKGVQLRQLAEQTAQDTRKKVEQTSVDAKAQVQTIKQRAVDYVDEQKNRVTRVANAVTQAAKENWHTTEPAAVHSEPQPHTVPPL
jgi:gas vesicle protein